MPNYYCLTCDRESTNERCRDCGDVGDELCAVCGFTCENCICEEEIA